MATDPVGGGSTRVSSCNSSSTVERHHVVVMPSTQLDSHLHSKAAEATKRRHWEEGNCSLTDGNHDDDLMTPPAVLLKRELKYAEQLANEVGISSEPDIDILDCWIRCIALTRIVHGQSHWLLAKAHICLGKAYVDVKGLPKQALLHAAKGRDILLSPECHVTSCDARNEVRYQLALAHCVAGQAHTLQGTLRNAEQELLKAEEELLNSEREFGENDFSGGPVSPTTASHGSTTHYQLQMELSTALARFDLKRERFSSSKKHFIKSIDFTKSVLGPESIRLVPLLRGKATAEANLSLYASAVQSLEVAQSIAERRCGSESVVMAELLQARGRLGVAQLRGGTSCELLATTEDVFSKAVLVFTALLGPKHEKTLSCKEELCNVLASQIQSREKAIPLLKELIKDKKDALGELATEVGHSLKLLSSLLLERGKVAQATPVLKEAKHVYSCSLGDKHKETVAVTRLIDSLTCSDITTFHQKDRHWNF